MVHRKGTDIPSFLGHVITSSIQRRNHSLGSTPSLFTSLGKPWLPSTCMQVATHRKKRYQAENLHLKERVFTGAVSGLLAGELEKQ